MALVQRGVHSLRSSAAQVGALALASQAHRGEDLLRSGRLAGDDLPAMLVRLRAAQQRFADAAQAVTPA